MVVPPTFGPSTGRFVEVCETHEANLKAKMKPMPSVVGVLSFSVAFLSFVFGITLMYEGGEVLGVIVLIVGVVAVLVPVIWAIKIRQ